MEEIGRSGIYQELRALCGERAEVWHNWGPSVLCLVTMAVPLVSSRQHRIYMTIGSSCTLTALPSNCAL